MTPVPIMPVWVSQGPGTAAPGNQAPGGHGGHAPATRVPGRVGAGTPAPTASVYWRRRFITLIVGLTVLALVGWAFDAALGGSAPAGRPAAATSVSGAVPSSSAATGGNAAGGRKPASHAAPAGHARPAGHAGQARNVLRSCPAGDVVLSLFSSQASYTLRQMPEFEVDVVSTASRSCTFDVGARHVLLRISSGTTQVWTSADCAEGQASLVTRLRRGIPTVVPIAWDGQHSSPGCPVPGAPAAAGTYSATASDGSGTSNALTFRIG